MAPDELWPEHANDEAAERHRTTLRDVSPGRWALLVLNVCLLTACVGLTATSSLVPWYRVPNAGAAPLSATASATMTIEAPATSTPAPPTPTRTPGPSGSGGGPAPTSTPKPPPPSPTTSPSPIPSPSPTATPSEGN